MNIHHTLHLLKRQTEVLSPETLNPINGDNKKGVFRL